MRVRRFLLKPVTLAAISGVVIAGITAAVYLSMHPGIVTLKPLQEPLPAFIPVDLDAFGGSVDVTLQAVVEPTTGAELSEHTPVSSSRPGSTQLSAIPLPERSLPVMHASLRVLLEQALEAGRMEEARMHARQVLLEDPSDERALVWMARFSSWEQDYETSLQLYDRLACLSPSVATYVTEKARVLGWMRRYGEALELYDAARERFPENPEVAAESRAKRALYNYRYRAARKAYAAWLRLAPGDPEALFDMAQLHAGAGRFSEALELLDHLLELYPSHVMATAVREKLRIVDGSVLARVGSASFSSRGGERSAYLDDLHLATMICYPFNDRFRLGVEAMGHWYGFSGEYDPDFRTFNPSIVLRYDNFPDLVLEGRVGTRYSSGELNDEPVGLLSLTSLPLDQLYLRASLGRRYVIENAETLYSSLSSDEVSGRVVFKPDRHWEVGLDGALSFYDDGNDRFAYGLDLRSHLSYEPSRLTLLWRWDVYGFGHEMAEYFTPGRFGTHRVGFEWRGYTDDERLYWGGRNTVFSLGYTMNFEPRAARSHTIYATVAHDWSNRVSTGIGYGRTWNDEEDIYDAGRLEAGVEIFL